MTKATLRMREALRWGVKVTLTVVALILATAAVSSAQDATGTPTVYKVTVKKVEFSSDGGATFVTLKEADQQMDIASVNAGAVAANYASGASLPAGIYNRIRVTISCNMRLRGQVAFGVNTFYTTAAGGTAANDATQLAEGPFTIPTPPCAGGSLTDTETVSFTVIEGQGKTVDVIFDVTGGIRVDAGVLSPNTVTVTYNFQ